MEEEFFNLIDWPSFEDNFCINSILNLPLVPETEGTTRIIGEYISPTENLGELVLDFENILQQINTLRNEQSLVQLPLSNKDYEYLSCKETKLITKCNSNKEKLDKILCSQILHPKYFSDILKLQNELNICIKTLTLFLNELNYYYSKDLEDESNCFASLCIYEEPTINSFKQRFSKQKFVVGIILAPKTKCKSLGKVKAKVVRTNTNLPEITLTNDEQEFDDKGYAIFSDLITNRGSRLKIIHYQFEVDAEFIIDDCPHIAKLYSEMSKGYIILSNESQWLKAEETVLRTIFFPEEEPININKFSNLLQIHFLYSTRQDLDNPRRPLSTRDFDFFFEKWIKNLANPRMIPVDKFDWFWSFYGKILHVITYRKIINSLWFSGIRGLFGFMKRRDSEYLLKNRDEGTFLIYCSSRVKGELAVAFVSSNKQFVYSIWNRYQDYPNEYYVIENNNCLKELLQCRKEFVSSLSSCCDKIIPKNNVLKEY